MSEIIDYNGNSFVTSADAARMAGVSRQRISSLVAQGAINAVRVGQNVLVNIEDAKEFAEKERKAGRPKNSLDRE